MRILYSDRPDHVPPCVATIGFFDGVHRGHQYLLQQVRHIAGQEQLLSAVVTFDVHPRQVVKADYRPELLTPLDCKLALLEATGIDLCWVLRFDAQMAAMSAREFMAQVLARQMHVGCLVVGYDHHFGHDPHASFDDYVRWGGEAGIRVVHADELDVADASVSSSRIRRALRQGDVVEADRCLGRPYALTGTVVGGEQQGRKMGFPTANLSLVEPCQLVPASGVYEVAAQIDDKPAVYTAMMNIGTRPTFHGDHLTLEVHILQFDGNLYGHRLTVAFRRRLREERPFDSPEALARQLRQDISSIEHPSSQSSQKL